MSYEIIIDELWGDYEGSGQLHHVSIGEPSTHLCGSESALSCLSHALFYSSFTVWIHFGRPVCPNCTKLDYSLPWVPSNILSKCEVNITLSSLFAVFGWSDRLRRKVKCCTVWSMLSVLKSSSFEERLEIEMRERITCSKGPGPDLDPGRCGKV